VARRDQADGHAGAFELQLQQPLTRLCNHVARALPRVLLVAATLLTACTGEVRTCQSPQQCPTNMKCVDGACQFAPFVDALVGTGEIKQADGGANACVAKPGGPKPRAEASGGVIDGLVLAIGGDDGATGRCTFAINARSDAWLHERCKAWQPMPADPFMPSPRSAAAVAVDTTGGRLYFYGGRHRKKPTSNWQLHRDLRQFDRPTGKWKLLSASGAKAVSHGGLALDRKRHRLYLIGGDAAVTGTSVIPVSLVMHFDLKTKQWQLSAALGAPPARARHAVATSADGKYLFVYGGVLANGAIDAQLWRLDLEKPKWAVVSAAGNRPTGRVGAGFVTQPASERLLLFGGGDATALAYRNDVWALDTTKLAWKRLYDGDLGLDKKYGGKLEVGNGINCASGKPAGGVPGGFNIVATQGPQRRAYAIVGWDVARNALVVFGGRGDCGPLADIWSFDPDASTWAIRDTTRTGWSCPRRAAADGTDVKACALLCLKPGN